MYVESSEDTSMLQEKIIITKELINQNIKNTKYSDMYLDPLQLIIQNDVNGSDSDSYLKINLSKTDLQTKYITSIKLNLVSKLMDTVPIAEEYISSLLANSRYIVLCGGNTIFDDHFYQSQNLIMDGFILPIQNLYENNININIVGIKDLLPTLNDFIIKISYTELEFEPEFEDIIKRNQMDQIIQKNNKFNLFRVLFGMGIKVFSEDLLKEEFNELSPKVGNIILV